MVFWLSNGRTSVTRLIPVERNERRFSSSSSAAPQSIKETKQGFLDAWLLEALLKNSPAFQSI